MSGKQRLQQFQRRLKMSEEDVEDVEDLEPQQTTLEQFEASQMEKTKEMEAVTNNFNAMTKCLSDAIDAINVLEHSFDEKKSLFNEYVNVLNEEEINEVFDKLKEEFIKSEDKYDFISNLDVTDFLGLNMAMIIEEKFKKLLQKSVAKE